MRENKKKLKNIIETETILVNENNIKIIRLFNLK